MISSRLVNVNAKIAEKVMEGYEAIECAVTRTYDKIEDSVVKGYEAVEDGFVNHFLKEEGETVQEAKCRLTNYSGQ